MKFCFDCSKLSMQPETAASKGKKRKLEAKKGNHEPTPKHSFAAVPYFSQQPLQTATSWIENVTNYLLSLPIGVQLSLMQRCYAPVIPTVEPVPPVVQPKPEVLLYMRPAPAGSKTLVLCMVYAAPKDSHASSHGQEGRDYMRLQSLEVCCLWTCLDSRC